MAAFTTNIAWKRFLQGMAVAVFLLAAPEVWGQAFVNGSIVGNVSDNSGAAVPGTTMTLTNLDTTAAIKVESDTGGKYQFLNFPPGRYRLEAEKAGFQRFTREPVTIQVNSSIRID